MEISIDNSLKKRRAHTKSLHLGERVLCGCGMRICLYRYQGVCLCAVYKNFVEHIYCFSRAFPLSLR